MGAMIADPELLPDHLYHPRRSPDGSSKAERFGSFCQQGRQLRHLLCTQSRLGPRRWLVPQGLHSLGLRLLEPLAHCPFTHPKCGGDVFLFPSRFMQFPGAHPSCFAPICWWCRFLAHTSFHRQFVLVLYFFLFRSIVSSDGSLGGVSELVDRCNEQVRDPCAWCGQHPSIAAVCSSR